MKDLVLGASQRWQTSLFASGIWPSHGWDDRRGDSRCQSLRLWAACRDRFPTVHNRLSVIQSGLAPPHQYVL